jgi:hypothetical protein
MGMMTKQSKDVGVDATSIESFIASVPPNLVAEAVEFAMGSDIGVTEGSFP